MQRLSVSDLQDKTKFEQLIAIDTQAMVKFIHEYYYRHLSPVLVFHYALSLGVLALCFWDAMNAGFSLDTFLTSFGLAVLAFIALLPLHEAIHGWTYQYFGAPTVEYKFALHKGYAYAIAPDYVINQREFYWLALMPSIVINIPLALAAFFLPEYRFFFLAALLLHISGTSGDFALINFQWLHRQRELFTYDDALNKISYFYARKSETRID